MKTKNLFACLGEALVRSRVLPALIAVLNLLPAGRVTAQTFTTLYSFSGDCDGTEPNGVILSGNTLYGMAQFGGCDSYPWGTVFKVNTDGTGFTNLHTFDQGVGEGGYPSGGLILSGNTLYGTAGGVSSGGTVFALNTDGTGFTILHHFTGGFPNYDPNDGANPAAGLVLSGNTLYGTTLFGGSSGYGTVFAMDTGGTGFTNLHSFTALGQTYATNSDGAKPRAGLILSGSTLYGTAFQGGSFGNGTVFAVNTNGTGFTNLYSFTARSGLNYTNSDGALPNGLVLSGNTLYGTAQQGGNDGNGTVFALNTDGTGFTILHSFPPTPSSIGVAHTNSDGANPSAGVIMSGSTLYGTAYQGGSFGTGTVFAVNTDGTGFTNLHSFTGSGGANPQAGLVLAGSTLYGTAKQGGGSSGYGTVFSLSQSLPPPPLQLTIVLSGTNLVLTWPAIDAPVTLQSTTDPASTPWAYPAYTSVIAGGQNIATIPIGGLQQFYRLGPIRTGGGCCPGGCTSDTDCGPGYQCIAGRCVDRQ